MEAKQKANELGNSMYKGSVFDKTKKEHLDELENAKRCALKCVDEIIEALKQTPNVLTLKKVFDYWQEVKQEIEKL